MTPTPPPSRISSIKTVPDDVVNELLAKLVRLEAQEKRIRVALASNDIRCPGGHWESLEIEQEFEESSLLRGELEARPDRFLHQETAARLRDVHNQLETLHESWIETGRCRHTITIHLESEYEDGSHRYPVAEGTCVSLLGLDDDTEYSSPIWSIYAERKRLLKILDDKLIVDPA